MSIAYDIDHVTWNIQQGGYDKRHVFDRGEDSDPEREATISQTIKNLGVAGVKSLSLIDTYGWQKHYGSNSAIAEHLGM